VKQLKPIFLLDLDHVLVQPHGYREGIRATLAYFTQQMGLGEIWPGEEVLVQFEAIGMTSEFDMIAVLLAHLMETLAEQHTELILPDGLEDAIKFVQNNSYTDPIQNLIPLITQLGARFTPGKEYAHLALELSQKGAPEPLFPLLAGTELLQQILGDVRSITYSLSTRVFQNLILGGDRYEAIYGLPRYFDGDAYLTLYDSALLDKKYRALLVDLWQSGKVGTVIFTARPSMPEFTHSAALYYSAESELALELLGLTDLPLMGGGQMSWLAEKLGFPNYKVLKPSPAQALAAIGVANGTDVRTALTAASELVFQGRTEGFSGLPPLSIHVFEDSGRNVKSVVEAGRLLNTMGIETRVSAWGIADIPAKKEALQSAGASVAANIQIALEAALQQEELLR
jgi:hypothetical protein